MVVLALAFFVFPLELLEPVLTFEAASYSFHQQSLANEATVTQDSAFFFELLW